MNRHQVIHCPVLRCTSEQSFHWHFQYLLRNTHLTGNVELVRLLIPLTNPKEHDSWPLRVAAGMGRTTCVKLLIPVSDPTAFYSQAIRDAADNGHYDVVKLLIPHSDPEIVERLKNSGKIPEYLFRK